MRPPHHDGAVSDLIARAHVQRKQVGKALTVSSPSAASKSSMSATAAATAARSVARAARSSSMSSGGGARAPASARSKCSLDSAVPPLASSYADPRRGRWPLWEGDDEAGVAVSLELAGEALAMASSRSCATRDSAASNSCTCVCVCVCVWVYVCVCVCVCDG